MTQQPPIKYRTDYTPPDFTITDIDLSFDLQPEKTTVTAVSQIKRINGIATDLSLHGESLTLQSLKINGELWKGYSLVENGITLHNVPSSFELTIINDIEPINNTALEGLYVSGNALCTQCEAEGFRHITFYLDRPDVLARFKTKIIADKARYPYLLSNGNRIAAGELADGKHWVEWQDPFPKPSYLFALVAGNFDLLEDSYTTRSGRKVALELFVDEGNLDCADWAMTCLKNAMKWDEQRFNLEYDLDIYMIVAVDFFNMGAMENKGLNVFNSKFVLAKPETATDSDYLNIESVIGHEYFHNWTGNRVTCRDWFQLSLKEGLTVFRDQEFSSDLGSRVVTRIANARVIRGAQFAEDASPMSHPIRPDKVMEMNNFYTVTVYEKGSEIIRMIHTLLGEEKFQAGMRLYIERHDGSAATCDDFVLAMQDASSIDLSHFKTWYSQSGTPILTIKDSYDVKNKRYSLQIKQHTPATADQQEKRALHIPVDIELYSSNGAVIPLKFQGKSLHHILNVNSASETFVFDEIMERPIISLLREFSAPVKIVYQYSDDDLILLMKHATNDFARYDASQMLLIKYIKYYVEHISVQNYWLFPEEIINAFKAVLTSDTLDPGLIAQIFTQPSESELAEHFDIIDPDAIYSARQFVIEQFARRMPKELYDTYYANISVEMEIDHEDISVEMEIAHDGIAKRSLRNSCLSYLVFCTKSISSGIELFVIEHYRLAYLMTNTLAALSAATKAQLLCQETLMTDFEHKWQHDGLVMDKWFMLQATSPGKECLERVKILLTHKSFTLTNPNRVRSLIGAFVFSNPTAFHAKDGSGYQFLVEVLMVLNETNPQLASRLIEPLIRFKRYDKKRRKLMINALIKLQKLPNLSNDLFEKITKALNDKQRQQLMINALIKLKKLPSILKDFFEK